MAGIFICIKDSVFIEPAMGSAAFLNEAINQLAEAYLDRKQKELGEMIPAEKRLQELQKVKMYIADRNVYGIDLNSVAVELAEVSLWLNTIYEGGFVPWFGTQLVNGNSLIGARRQCYRIENLKATTKSLRWYENAPERVLMTEKRMPKKQVYHFLLGDPGMCSYSDKVIKDLEPENIKAMSTWNKMFNAPYDDDDIATLLRLSAVIDNLWDSQVKLRQEVEAKTQDKLSVYGYRDKITDSHTTIRQKDKILSELYKSEHMRNAGPYARLKFAMDYWCALWFWPIDKADLLPTRSEFFFDMSLILEGTVASVNTSAIQPELFPTEMQSMAQEIVGTYGVDTVVDIPRLRKDYPRLNLAYEIAEQNHFMHWELEFADLFKERGGFDLVIGNPPWVKLIWNEQNAISDSNPLFAIKNLTATETTKIRSIALGNKETYLLYFFEYESMSGEQSFLNAFSNYPSLKGQQTNLYKCFLPQAWMYGAQGGVSAFVHPDGVFDDPKGGILRKELYPKLRYHFNFRNEMVLFQGILHLVTFSLNVYKNTLNKKPQFKTICNLFIPKTIDESFDSVGDGSVGGIKDENGWNTVGHKDRIISIGPKELLTFAMLFDQSREWEMARIPVLHAKELVEVLDVFAEQQFKINSIEGVTSTIMLDETQSQKNGTIKREVGFPDNIVGMVFSGPHFGQANPFYKTPKRECKLHSDYDCIDLSEIDKNYLPRSNYAINCSITDYYNQSSKTEWGIRYIDCYKLISRRMLSQTGERTLISAIIPPKSNCINTVTSIVFAQDIDLLQTAAVFSSLPYDALIKMLGRSDFYYETAQSLPKVEGVYGNDLIIRALLLNALSSEYEDLFNGARKKLKSIHGWSKIDSRLNDTKLIQSPERWCFNAPLRMDYERRQALVEIDVLTAMALGISLEQLTVMYRILFPVLQSYESDTWYDANGRIVFTNNRSLVGVGFDRSKWENDIKGAPAGKKFYRTIMDDTMPGGPVERTIEYVAPFDRCDREKDYEIAWKFFEEKYGKVK